MSAMDAKDVLRKMLLIRRMEQKIEQLFSQGLLRGTAHCCIGQEAVPVALSYLLNIDKDYLCSGHRSHGLSMMMTEKPEALLGEMMGKPFGMAKGVGGSQHVHYKNYFTNGVTGGMTPIATGIAFALKNEQTDVIATVVFGDGAMNEGYVLESFNLAETMNLPVLFVLENNGYAMSTPSEAVNPEPFFENRIKGFGLPYSKVDSSDFERLFNTLKHAVEEVRTKRSPQFVEVATHRFCGHSKSDKRAYIPRERDDYWHEHDTIKNVASKLRPEEVDQIEKDVAAEVERVTRYCFNN